MTDNTTLNPGGGGDVIRDLDRGGGSKTQVMQIDVGGASTNAEKLVTAGQQTSANSIPVVIASDQNTVGRLPVDDSANPVLTQILMELRAIKFVLSAAYGLEVPPILEENELQ